MRRRNLHYLARMLATQIDRQEPDLFLRVVFFDKQQLVSSRVRKYTPITHGIQCHAPVREDGFSGCAVDNKRPITKLLHRLGTGAVAEDLATCPDDRAPI